MTMKKGISMDSPLVIGIYGTSNSGKTTLITELIRQLALRGYRIGTIKQTNKPISMDVSEKDTWRHKDAGANIVVLSSTIETTFLLPTPINVSIMIEKMTQLLDLDIILIEGANDPSIPKIRIGSIECRENTLFTYDGDINNLLNYIQGKIRRG
ncbi:MAG: molybdopterin-guanine dinucleotide biosynthesis protein B [Thermoplasmatota archaeon]